ncbi:MAG: TerB N-terminal domain-containing protein [Clostridia bacterium]|nr:TerB N-terminal domain-containing protein [Clostridia bacterium]
MEKSDKNSVEKDDFWDLSDLVPKRKTRLAFSANPRSTDAVEVQQITHRIDKNVAMDVPLTERFVHPEAKQDQKPKSECTYQPDGALVREVRIYPWKSEYSYYEQFREHANRLASKEGEACPEVDFFSYMPQYTQLSNAQLKYYLWWRTNFRRGICLPCAYSYLLLYLYELINLDEMHQNPIDGQQNMLRLWLSYREKHTRLDVLVREWLCDYSLLHRLPPPRLDPSQYRVLLAGGRLKEFYVPSEEGLDALSVAVLLFCNNYDYTKSKFYRADTKADYDRVLGGAIREALAFLREQSGKVLTDVSGISTLSRDTFTGAVCSWRLKRRIEVDYTSFSHTHELRYIMTDVLKYAENALRASRGIKSRLSIYALSIPLRERLDAYLAAALPQRATRSAAKQREAVPEYERRYDLPVTAVSPERAAKIEAESWQTTKRLVEAFEGEKMAENPQTVSKNDDFLPFAEQSIQPVSAEPTPPPTTQQTRSVTDAASPFAKALGVLVGFLPFAAAKDRQGQRDFAKAIGLMPDAVADKINTVAGDMMGDIVLEEENGAYVILEDYKEFLIEQGVLSNGI